MVSSGGARGKSKSGKTRIVGGAVFVDSVGGLDRKKFKEGGYTDKQINSAIEKTKTTATPETTKTDNTKLKQEVSQPSETISTNTSSKPVESSTKENQQTSAKAENTRLKQEISQLKKSNNLKIKTYKDFKNEILNIHNNLDDGENLVNIYKMRRELGDRVSRQQFNKWLIKTQEDGDFQLIGGQMTGITPDQYEDSLSIESAKASPIRYYAKRLNKPDGITEKNIELENIKLKKELEKLKAKKQKPSKTQALKSKKIENYTTFEKEALSTYDNLNKDYNFDNLVPIARLRKQMGDRVSKAEFDQWLLDMQEKDLIQLIGGKTVITSSETLSDFVKTPLGAEKYYIKKL